jgi:peptide alpha-N-acetyltransferase
MLKRLCNDSYKKEAIKNLLEGLSNEENPTSDAESPVRKTFALMCLAAFYDHNNQYTKALSLVEKAIAVTPTLIDLYVMKAKIQKHASDMHGSAETWEFARKLDLADRYLNSKAVKAMLRVNQIDKARETIMLFAKDSTDSTKSNLGEMQCMWWEFELGKAHARVGETEKAREVWKGTLKHYEDMAEDEFDFALYCLRRMTLRAYMDFLRYGSRMKGHKFYRRTVEEIEKLEKSTSL